MKFLFHEDYVCYINYSILQKNFYQNPVTGANNIESASVAFFTFYAFWIDCDGDCDEVPWLTNLIEIITDLNEKNEHI